MYYKKYINLLVWSLVFLNVTTNTINAQVSISGPSCVVAGTTTTYTIGGNFNTSSKYLPKIGWLSKMKYLLSADIFMSCQFIIL